MAVATILLQCDRTQLLSLFGTGAVVITEKHLMQTGAGIERCWTRDNKSIEGRTEIRGNNAMVDLRFHTVFREDDPKLGTTIDRGPHTDMKIVYDQTQGFVSALLTQIRSQVEHDHNTPSKLQTKWSVVPRKVKTSKSTEGSCVVIFASQEEKAVATGFEKESAAFPVYPAHRFA